MYSEARNAKLFSGSARMKRTVKSLREMLYSMIRGIGERAERYAKNPGQDFP